jgi:hypothetical protein
VLLARNQARPLWALGIWYQALGIGKWGSGKAVLALRILPLSDSLGKGGVAPHFPAATFWAAAPWQLLPSFVATPSRGNASVPFNSAVSDWQRRRLPGACPYSAAPYRGCHNRPDYWHTHLCSGVIDALALENSPEFEKKLRAP